MAASAARRQLQRQRLTRERAALPCAAAIRGTAVMEHEAACGRSLRVGRSLATRPHTSLKITPIFAFKTEVRNLHICARRFGIFEKR